MKTSLLYGIGVAIAGALLLVSCGGGGSTSSPSAAAPTAPTTTTPAPAPSTSTVTVSIVGLIGNGAYKPNPVMANTGDAVVFRNNDAATHHIVMDDGSADLGDVAPGATSRSLTLRNANATKFHCTIHPSMVGSINDTVAPEPKPCPDPYGYNC
jgi:plastocyanin